MCLAPVGQGNNDKIGIEHFVDLERLGKTQDAAEEIVSAALAGGSQ